MRLPAGSGQEPASKGAVRIEGNVAKQTERAPLEPNEGPIAIVTASDRGSARHVRWLTSIKLEAVAP